MARVIKTFKYSRGTSLNIEKTDGIVQKYLFARTNYFKVLMTQYWSLIGFKLLITAAMLIVGSVLLVDQQINIGQFIAADIVILSVIASVEKLIGNLDKVYDVLTSVEKLDKIAGSEVETDGTIVLPEAQKGVAIDFKEISFGYANTGKILNKINFSIEAGQKVCIMGPSGSGKSTVLKLLTGAFKNYTGAVLINNIPIGNYSIDSIRSQTGILLSQQDIFNGTIWENITMGNKEISYDEVTSLVKQCGLSTYVDELQKGYDTVLDPTGNKLSSTVRQDILLLRALLGKRRLLLLEEPLASLDEVNKKHVAQFMLGAENATVIIASNDIDIAKQCDLVIYLENGNIKATGTWSQIASLLN